MIYLLHGTDVYKSRAKLHEMLDILAKKRPNSEIFKFKLDNWDEEKMTELFSGIGLFEEKYIVVLDNLFPKKDVKEFIMSHLEEMKDAPHPFLILENKIDTTSLKKLEKFSLKAQEFAKLEEKKSFNQIFSITDALLAKDKKKLWTNYVDFISKDIAPEEIHGILFWQVKNMILAGFGQKESGLAPFQYSKALSGAKKYSSEVLQKMSNDLVQMTTKVRNGEGDMEIMLEKWLLTL